MNSSEHSEKIYDNNHQDTMAPGIRSSAESTASFAPMTDPGMTENMPDLTLRRKYRRIGWAAFLIPFLALWLAYIVQGVFPFGDRHILTIDLYHQYAPFLAEYRRILLGKGSLFFSWHGGLGIPFYALWAHYLASPFNLLMIIFPESMLTEAVLVISLLKVGLAGYSFAFFLRKRRGGSVLTTDLIFSSAYALSGWVLAYSWNIMWLDSIFLLPLIAAALFTLIEEGRIGPYVFWLSLAIITNYYMAFFIAVFLIAYFFYLVAISRVVSSFKAFCKTFGKFVLGSLWSAVNSLFIIIPVVAQLAQTSAVADKFPNPWDMTFFSVDFLQRLMPFTPPDIRSGLPNLFAGTLMLVLLPLYFFARNISLKQKISSALVIGFMLISFNLNGLDFIWNGLHYPNQLPYRYAFLLIFFILTLGEETLPHLRSFSKQTWVVVCIGYTVVILLLQKIDLERYPHFTVLGTLLIIGIYALILYIKVNRPHSKAYRDTLSLVLVIVVVLELTINSIFAIDHIAANEYYGSRDDYSTGEVVTNARKLRDRIPQDPFYRATMIPGKSVNNSMLYGLNGVTFFSSTMAEEPVKFFKGLGIDTNGINSYEYESGSILLDRLFGIRYRIFRNEAIPDQAYMTKINQIGSVSLWEDPEALSPAYFVPETAGDYVLHEGVMPFEAQNQLAQALGAKNDIYNPIALHPDPIGAGVTVTDEVGSDYHIELNNNTDPTLILKPDSFRDGAYFLSWKSSGIKVSNVMLRIEDQEITIDGRSEGLADLGKWTTGRDYSIAVKFKDTESKSGSIKIQLVEVDDMALSSFTEKLREGEMPLTVKGASFSGECECPESGYVLLSSPPTDRQVTVNRQPVETQALAGGLTLIPVRAGHNVISSRYLPQGFVISVIIAAATWLLFIVFCVIKRRKADKSTHRQVSEEGGIRQVQLK